MGLILWDRDERDQSLSHATSPMVIDSILRVAGLRSHWDVTENNDCTSACESMID